MSTVCIVMGLSEGGWTQPTELPYTYFEFVNDFLLHYRARSQIVMPPAFSQDRCIRVVFSEFTDERDKTRTWLKGSLTMLTWTLLAIHRLRPGPWCLRLHLSVRISCYGPGKWGLCAACRGRSWFNSGNICTAFRRGEFCTFVCLPKSAVHVA